MTNLSDFFNFASNDSMIKTATTNLKESFNLNTDRFKKMIKEINSLDTEYKRQFCKVKDSLDKVGKDWSVVKNDPNIKTEDDKMKKLMDVYKIFLEIKKECEKLKETAYEDLLFNLKIKFLKKRERDGSRGDKSKVKSISIMKRDESNNNLSNNLELLENTNDIEDDYSDINNRSTSILNNSEELVAILKTQFPDMYITNDILKNISKNKIIKEIPIDQYQFPNYEKLENMMIKIKLSKVPSTLNLSRNNSNSNSNSINNISSSDSSNLDISQYYKYFEPTTLIVNKNAKDGMIYIGGKRIWEQNPKEQEPGESVSHSRKRGPDKNKNILLTHLYLSLTNQVIKTATPHIIYAKICFYRIYEDMILDSDFTLPKEASDSDCQSYLYTINSIEDIRSFLASQYK